MNLEPIICPNNVEVVLTKLQEYIQNGGIINSLYLVDKTDEEVVVLVCDQEITKPMIEMFWAGYQAALK